MEAVVGIHITHDTDFRESDEGELEEFAEICEPFSEILSFLY